MSGHLWFNALSPVLGTIIVWIIEIDTILPIGITGDALNGTGMKTEQFSINRRSTNAHRIWVDQFISFIVVRVVGGIKETHKSRVIGDMPCHVLKHFAEAIRNPFSIESRIDPLMRIVSPELHPSDHFRI